MDQNHAVVEQGNQPSCGSWDMSGTGADEAALALLSEARQQGRTGWSENVFQVLGKT